MELRTRKPNRLKNYDYSAPGCYFITICVKERAPLFWTHDVPRVGADIIRPHTPDLLQQSGTNKCDCGGSTRPFVLSRYGKIVEQAILQVPNYYPNVTLNKYVIMPNHVHILLSLVVSDGRMVSAPTKSIGTIIGQMKRSVSKMAGFSLWQKGFHDHIVRNRADYLRVWNYIENNPTCWEEDCYYMVPED